MQTKKRIIEHFLILGILVLGLLYGCSEKTSTPEEAKSSYELIEEDLKAGKLDKEKALVYEVYSIFEQEKLPKKYRSEVNLPSGTPILVKVRRNWDSLSEKTKQELEPYFVNFLDPRFFYNQKKRKTSFLEPSLAYAEETLDIGGIREAQDIIKILNLSYQDSANGKVRIWFNRASETERRQASWILDSLNEHGVWDKEVALMGREVKSDNGRIGNDNKLDIYILPISAMGLAIPGPVVNKKTYSLIVIKKGQSKKKTQNTLAHELFHALQFNINIEIENWWSESTATWIEDYIYPDYDLEHIYLPNYFGNIEKGLKFQNGRFEYGAYVWSLFLQQNYGAQIVGKIWQYCQNNVVEDAFLANLGEQEGFRDAFKKYALWLYNKPPVRKFLDGNKPNKFLPATPVMNLHYIAGVDRGIVDVGEIYPLGVKIFTFDVLDKEEVRSIYFKFSPLIAEKMVFWVIKKIKDEEKVVEDWENTAEKSFCFDLEEEDLEEITFIFGNPTFFDRFAVSDISYEANKYGCEAKLDLDIVFTKGGGGKWKHPAASMWFYGQEEERINLSVLFLDPKNNKKTEEIKQLVPLGGFSYFLRGSSRAGESPAGMVIEGKVQVSGQLTDIWTGESLESKKTKSTITLSIKAGKEESLDNTNNMTEEVPLDMQSEFARLQEQLNKLQQMTSQSLNTAKSLGMKEPGKDELKYKISLYLREVPYTVITSFGDEQQVENSFKEVGPIELEDIFKKDKKTIIINEIGKFQGANLKIKGALRLKK